MKAQREDTDLQTYNKHKILQFQSKTEWSRNHWWSVDQNCKIPSNCWYDTYMVCCIAKNFCIFCNLYFATECMMVLSFLVNISRQIWRTVTKQIWRNYWLRNEIYVSAIDNEKHFIFNHYFSGSCLSGSCLTLPILVLIVLLKLS